MEDVERLYFRWTEVAHVVPIMVVVWVANVISQRVLKGLSERLDHPRHLWQKTVVIALGPPLRVGLWLLGGSIALKVLAPGPEPSPLTEAFTPLLTLGGIAVAAWFLMRLAGGIERVVYLRAEETGKPLDPMATDAVAKIVQASIVLVAVVEGLRTLGLSLSGLLAVGGIGGVALGFASQGLVANLLGGLTVYLSQPFKVGEWIIMPEDDVMGQVQSIGWRSTRILGFDRRPFYVPNSKFNTAILINHSRMTNRRIAEYVHVRYKDIDKVPAIVQDARQLLLDHPGIQKDFFVVNFDSYGEFALKLYVYAFTYTTSYVEYMQVKEDILLGVADIVQKHGAQLAVPTSTVHVPEGIRVEPGRPELMMEPDVHPQ